MNTRVTARVLFALGIVDLVVLNVMLAPRLENERRAIVADTTTREYAAAVTTVPVAAVAVERAPATAPGAQHAIWADTVAPAPATPAQPTPAPERAMENVAFGFDSTDILRLDAVYALRRLARDIAASPSRHVLLRGHSDPVGIPEQNLELSRRRAEAVRDYLVSRGAPAERITVEAMGPNEPADPSPTPAAWAKDRRVEVLWR
jgi:outer membrane protein OmpA-like peptidoglycan-associated protein